LCYHLHTPLHSLLLIFLPSLYPPPPPIPTLFPYTTLFRSQVSFPAFPSSCFRNSYSHDRNERIHRTAKQRGAAKLTQGARQRRVDRKSTRLNSSHSQISYAVFCLKKKKKYRADACSEAVSP